MNLVERLTKILDASHGLDESQVEDIEQAADRIKELEAKVEELQADIS